MTDSADRVPHEQWFRMMANASLPDAAARALESDGFVVIPGPLTVDQLPALAEAYARAVLEADPTDVSVKETTRVHDFVNRGAIFDPLWVHPPILDACCRTIGGPFKLSTLIARTLMPQSRPQGLHVDFAADDRGWPMLGFILMIDEFRPENGATRFVPGSQRWRPPPGADRTVPDGVQVPACGPAGSVIVYNGSVWHGYGANVTDVPRRSIQCAYTRWDAPRGLDLPARMRPDTLARISPLAKHLLAL